MKDSKEQVFEDLVVEQTLNNIGFQMEWDTIKEVIDEAMDEADIDGKREIGYNVLEASVRYNNIDKVVNALESIINDKELMGLINKK